MTAHAVLFCIEFWGFILYCVLLLSAYFSSKAQRTLSDKLFYYFHPTEETPFQPDLYKAPDPVETRANLYEHLYETAHEVRPFFSSKVGVLIPIAMVIDSVICIICTHHDEYIMMSTNNLQ